MEQAGPNSTTETLDALVVDLETYIREAFDILDTGEYTELNALEEKVSVLCRRVTEIPLAEARDFRSKLGAIIKQLDLLQSIMTEHRDKIGEQLQGLDTSHRASRAYAKSEAMVPDKRPSDSDTE